MVVDPDPLYFKLIKIAIILVVSLIIFKWSIYIVKRIGARFSFDLTLIQVIKEIIKYAVIAAALTLCLSEFGVDVNAIIVSLGIVGIAVGFAARDTLSNFIAGMFILADKSFKVGDIIEMSGKKGKVIKLGLRVTTIKTDDNKIITIPNSTFSSSVHVNYTCLDTRRVELDINIPYELELEETVKSLVKAASKCKWALPQPKPNVLIKEMTDTGIEATITVWVEDPWNVDTYRSQLALKVKGLLVVKDCQEYVKE
ncbi:MAG: small conductance mechanosensitive channel [Methanobacterium sp.]|jgi:small conductance mechanosensitive channel|uniref:mechanosensitive ion channel family protein n=1 Tax=Methanobacterium sp. TaxID=2164 RepID=UPI0003C93A7A|nr:mechanosensitive ion channel family protein [Methanobacterium sp.]MDI3549274.1 small conductance mechanosensitive channel [Methanobacterium sp.]CDG65433.1 mechanosensitive ion channel MscS [Methanobacterium sp. MB1]